jgi:hypothetical protein
MEVPFMKKFQMVLLALVLSFSIAGTGNAALYDRGADNLGNHLIYDSGLNITWYDAPAVQINWNDAMAWASGLTLGGVSGWRLPWAVDGPPIVSYNSTTSYGYNNTSNEMGHLFYAELGNAGLFDVNGNRLSDQVIVNKGPFANLQSYSVPSSVYWTAIGSTQYPRSFNFNSGYLGSKLNTDQDAYALAVHDGDVGAPVPIPGAVWLMGTGLMGLVGLRKKFQA